MGSTGFSDVAARLRRPASGLACVAFLLAASATRHPWTEEGVANAAMECLGHALVGVGILGRLWVFSYNKGHRGSELLMTGPYSVVRHPLYLFSALALAGFGLLTESLVLSAAMILAFAVYYRLVVAAEESKMLARFGEDWRAYGQRVPRFVPALRLFHEPDEWTIVPGRYRNAFAGGAAMLVAMFALDAIDLAKQLGWIQPLGTLP